MADSLRHVALTTCDPNLHWYASARVEKWRPLTTTWVELPAGPPEGTRRVTRGSKKSN